MQRIMKLKRWVDRTSLGKCTIAIDSLTLQVVADILSNVLDQNNAPAFAATADVSAIITSVLNTLLSMYVIIMWYNGH